MDRKKLVFVAMLLISTLVLSPQLGNAFRLEDLRPALINAEGQVTIQFDSTALNVSVKTSFEAMVPKDLPDGNYTAHFQGEAYITNESIRFRGEMEIEDIAEFHVSFTVPNVYQQAIANLTAAEEEQEESWEHGICITYHEYDAQGSLAIEVSSLATIPKQFSWLRLLGEVTQYGSSPAYGKLLLNARIDKWVKAHILWQVLNTSIPWHHEFSDMEDFTLEYSFYAASLVNATSFELNSSKANLYLEGLWNVYELSWVYSRDEDFNFTIQVIARNASGILAVTNDWSSFAANITGLDTVSGRIFLSIFRSIKIPNCDFNGDYVVDIFDMVHIAKAIGSTPGKGCYDFDEDIDMNFSIDIYDLVEVANEFGITY